MKKKIAIAGLGLIGGSMAKALKAYTEHEVIGFDIQRDVVASALADKSIDFPGSVEALKSIDILLIALYPGQAVEFVKEHAGLLPQGTIICDFCGVKRYVSDSLDSFCRERGFRFVGGHPMAGREYSGYAYSTPELFKRASMILTETENTDKKAIDELFELFKPLGFLKIVVTTPENHDRMIAYTSQLAHVVSNAFIKSPEAMLHKGYSANSYRDLTRVARLNEDMWSELFLFNREPLLREIDFIIKSLGEYREAIDKGDLPRLKALLKEGSDLKKAIDE